MMAFERLEPFGALAEEFRAGQVAAIVANVNRSPKDTPEPYKAADFMPALRRAREDAEERAKPPVRGENLTPDQYADLFDAMMFGQKPTVH